jgi:hypothetical protein
MTQHLEMKAAGNEEDGEARVEGGEGGERERKIRCDA